MTTLLAIDSATDALSLAVYRSGVIRRVHRVMPRQHQQQLFACLNELLDGQAPARLGLDAIVYGRGPGSFTGLRIAASAAQGLAYSLEVPVVGISTLETQARTYLRREERAKPCLVLSTIDARIGQVYAGFFVYDGKNLLPAGGPMVAEPASLMLPEQVSSDAAGSLVVIGDGFESQSAIPGTLGPVASHWPDILPEAEDMFGIALDVLARGGGDAAADAVPDYVQKRIGWKTLSEQGRKA